MLQTKRHRSFDRSNTVRHWRTVVEWDWTLPIPSSGASCRLLKEVQDEACANSLRWINRVDGFIVGGAGLTMYIFSILDTVILSLAGLSTYRWRMIGMNRLERCRHEEES